MDNITFKEFKGTHALRAICQATMRSVIVAAVMTFAAVSVAFVMAFIAEEGTQRLLIGWQSATLIMGVVIGAVAASDAKEAYWRLERYQVAVFWAAYVAMWSGALYTLGIMVAGV